jgi:hypothetical protein
MTDLSNDLFQSEVESFSHAPTLDPVKPLLCDRWLALSALQKSIRRGDSLTAKRALTTLYRSDPSSTWRRLLIIACEDVGIAAPGAVVMTASRCANVKALREKGRDEAAALATAQMLAEVPKDRSADLLFAVALHDPTLEVMRSKCRSASVARRLEFVADPTLSLPARALAVWHSSGVESYGEQRVGLGDLDALMRTYAELGIPERLLEALATVIKKAREPFTLLLPLLWLAAAGTETELLDSPLSPSGLINGVPLYVAIVSAEDQMLVGGTRNALDAVVHDAQAAGAERTTVLPVAVPSHTPLLAEASHSFRQALGKAHLPAEVPPGVRMLRGIDGDTVFDVRAGADKLGRGDDLRIWDSQALANRIQG